MAIDWNNLPDPVDTEAPKVDPSAGPPASVTAGESPPETALPSRLEYWAGRVKRGFLAGEQPDVQTDPKTGEKYIIDPITKEKTAPLDVPALQAAPDRLSEVVGSGLEEMGRHPILSGWMPVGTFAAGASNELLKDFPTPVREGVAAAINLVGPSGIAHMASNVGHLATGHFGGIGTMLHALWNAPATAHGFNAANALNRVAKAITGGALGSETPLSRAPDQATQPALMQRPDASPADRREAEGDDMSIGAMANRLYHWGGALPGLPSAADIVNNALAPPAY